MHIISRPYEFLISSCDLYLSCIPLSTVLYMRVKLRAAILPTLCRRVETSKKAHRPRMLMQTHGLYLEFACTYRTILQYMLLCDKLCPKKNRKFCVPQSLQPGIFFIVQALEGKIATCAMDFSTSNRKYENIQSCQLCKQVGWLIIKNCANKTEHSFHHKPASMALFESVDNTNNLVKRSHKL